MEKKELINSVINAILVVIGLVLVITGQKVISATNALIMLVGLACILVAIYRYNKKYQ